MRTAHRHALALRDRCATLAAKLIGRVSYQEQLRTLIAEHAPKKSFIDVGCMWNVDGAYAFHALAMGATQVVGLDVTDATPGFHAANAKAGNRVRFVCDDINSAALPEQLGRFDVVFCSGVLYHVPNPVFMLERLRAICGQVLILGSAIIAELDVPQAAVYYPLLSDQWRRRLAYRTPATKIGLDTPYTPEWNYANFFWGFSVSCLEAMVRTAGFDIERRHRWRHASCLVCRPAGR